MAIPAEFLDELKARADLVAIVSRRVALTRKGREHLGLCPFHQEKTPSFTVNEQKGFYHCFGCGAHGSVIDFVMQADRLEFREAISALATSVGLTIPDDRPDRTGRGDRQEQDRRTRLLALNEAAALYFEEALRGPEGRTARAYLRSRGLDEDLIAHFRLGYAADGGGGLRAALARDNFSEEAMLAAGLLARGEDEARPPYARFRNRVMFPIADARGRIVGFGGRSLGDAQPKYLNTAETEIFQKGRLLYGLSQATAAARRRGTVVVVEGYMDVIGLARAGIDYAVAPLGTALTEDQMRLLWRLAPEPILCFDPDRAGRRAAMRAADRALPLMRTGVGLRFAFLGQASFSAEGVDDPDARMDKYLALWRGDRSRPKQAFERGLETAISISDLLFWMETGRNLPSSAEARAAAEARMRRRLERIEDRDLRASFVRDFRQRLWQRPQRARGAAPASWRRAEEPPPVAATPRRVPPLSPIAMAERTLLACLLTQPAVFAHKEEDIGSLSFSMPGPERLRQALVEILALHPGVSGADLRAVLCTRGLRDELSDLLTDPMLAPHLHVRHNTPAEELEAGWKACVSIIRAAAASDAEADANAFADEAMRRRQLLRRAALDGGDEDVI